MATTMLLSDDLLEAVFGLDEQPAVLDPETEQELAGHELPSDDEEFAAPPRDES